MIKDRHLKKICLIYLACFIGCASADMARYVTRHCPVKRVYDDEAFHVVLEDIKYDGNHVYIVGNCWRDAMAIAEWCKVNGIEFEQKWSKNHTWLKINGKDVEYIDGIGVVAR